ncbi:MAG: hypothetical protein QXN23_01670 [Candidatus Caldarchaeum sp.]|jgi:hypothetical protein
MGAYPHGRESRQDDVVVAVGAPGEPSLQHLSKQQRLFQKSLLRASPSTAT